MKGRWRKRYGAGSSTEELEKVIARQKQELVQKNHEIAQLIYALMLAKEALLKKGEANCKMFEKIQEEDRRALQGHDELQVSEEL